ncbi:MAG: polysaccharide deacetylase family protein [Deltaproteobacteria bacterium]|nr:MAG: polysaccharide deacetylase family protein [Deltaproteobacteria bacterium]
MPPALLERLGFAAADRVAVVHVDDIGMCHDANEGGFEALANGPATCGSVMVPCPWFSEAAARARANPDFDLGVHLTLNSEWDHYRWGPVAGRDAVPSLLDDEGYLPKTTLETLQRATPEDVEVELRAQIEHALAAGIDVTHLDSHMGTVFYKPEFLAVYARLAREFRVPVFVARPSVEQLEILGLAAARPVFLSLADDLESDGFPILDGFDLDSLAFEPGDGLAHNRRRLARFTPGVHYLICHAARGGDELRAISPDAHARDFERSFYGGDAGQRALDEAGIRTVGMRPLRELLRSEP